MLTKEANRKLRCDISESKKSVQKIEKEARRAVEVLSNKETVAVQIEENFKKKIQMNFLRKYFCMESNLLLDLAQYFLGSPFLQKETFQFQKNFENL